MAEKGTKGSLLLQIGGAALTGYGIYLLFGKDKSEKTLLERQQQGGGGGGGTIASASSGTYYPNVPSPVADYKQGCTDPLYQEFDPEATDLCPEAVYSNGQCFGTTALNYEKELCLNKHVKGCTDSEATNFNPNATQDDGSCEFLEEEEEVFGCTDAEADNFNSEATSDDGSCQFAEEEVISGCTNPNAFNFNPNATQDDGSCQIRGCTCETAQNYNPEANVDSGTCKVCTLPQADNYSPCFGLDVLPDNNSCIIGGCNDPQASNYNPLATYNDNSCAYSDAGGGATRATQRATRIPISTELSQNNLSQKNDPKTATSMKIGFDGGGVILKGYEDALDSRRRCNNGEFA